MRSFEFSFGSNAKHTQRLLTWLLLQHVPDWRWGQNSKDTFWYPNHKLFRQKIRGDWDSVFDDVKNELSNLNNKINMILEKINTTNNMENVINL